MPAYLLTNAAGQIEVAYRGPAGAEPAGAVAVSDAIYAELPRDISGWSYVNGALVPPVPPAPTLAQQGGAAIAGGLSIALSGTITLAATLFPTDPATQQKVGAVVTTLTATGAFPGGAATYPMRDSSGTWHSFDAAQYKAVAGAIAAYVATLTLIADGWPGAPSVLPSASVALAV